MNKIGFDEVPNFEIRYGLIRGGEAVDQGVFCPTDEVFLKFQFVNWSKVKHVIWANGEGTGGCQFNCEPDSRPEKYNFEIVIPKCGAAKASRSTAVKLAKEISVSFSDCKIGEVCVKNIIRTPAFYDVEPLEFSLHVSVAS